MMKSHLMRTLIHRFLLVAVMVAVIALVIIAMRPAPILVETASVGRGQFRVTIDEEGETRAHDRFVVASPVAGNLLRIGLREGDPVAAGQAVALVKPLPIDQRERAEITARIQAAEALKRSADQAVAHARTDYEQALRDLRRSEELAEAGDISVQALEQAKNNAAVARSERDAAEFKVEAAAADVNAARAGLIAIEAEQSSNTKTVVLRSPVRGKVLRLTEKSERVVPAGAPILTVGDPRLLEIVVDLLSTDAVKVKPGATVYLENWGGDHALRARVRVVEPSAFTKVSALGIEEQRTNIVADFVDPPGPLGDAYRVEARIVVWESEQVLKAAASALFRSGDGWAVFVVDGGIARRRDVEIGHRNAFEVEIIGGLSEGEIVILHPANDLTDGTRVVPR